MNFSFEEIKQNSFRLVEYLPPRYELAFAASLLDEPNICDESSLIWRILRDRPTFQADHSSVKAYLDQTGNTDDFYMYYVKNKAATIAALFGWNPDICAMLALEVINSIEMDRNIKRHLIRTIKKRYLPTIAKHN